MNSSQNSKFVAMSIHDIRLSEIEQGLTILEYFRNTFNCPLTVHLIVDAKLEKSNRLLEELIRLVNLGTHEIVFHGVRHACSKQTYEWASFYHNFEAEFLEKNKNQHEIAKQTYTDLSEFVGRDIGFCPPCWLITNENKSEFLKKNILYIEGMFSIQFPEKKLLSPVISIGAPNPSNIKYLKILGNLIYSISKIVASRKIRLVYHVSDFKNETALEFLNEKANQFLRRKFEFKLQSDLIASF